MQKLLQVFWPNKWNSSGPHQGPPFFCVKNNLVIIKGLFFRCVIGKNKGKKQFTFNGRVYASLTVNISIVGLGPGGVDYLPAKNLEILQKARRIFLRTEVHPVVDWIKQQQIHFESYDHYYEKADSFEEVYQLIKDNILKAAAEDSVVYAVPGHPLVAETSVEMILAEAERAGLTTEVAPAMSFLDAIYATIKINPVKGLQIIDGLELSNRVWDPAMAMIVVQVYNRLVASDIKIALLESYPPEHEVALVRAAGVPGEERVQFIPLYEMDRFEWLDHLTSLYVPGVNNKTINNNDQYNFMSLIDIMGKLRGEDGCPWDREQDHHTLTPYLLEETYEVLEAIQQENMYNICEELGDLLLQIVFHAQIAKERGFFNIDDVVNAICSKMINRHPHVFGNLQVHSSSEVLDNWDKIKQSEKEGDKNVKTSLLDGVPRGFPALLRSLKIQKKAARVGFDWPDYKGALNKVEEELSEWKEALSSGQRDRIEHETGDIIFAVVNVARIIGVDPEVALAATTDKFIRRFQHIEKKAFEMGVSLHNMTLKEMDILWEQAKKEEN